MATTTIATASGARFPRLVESGAVEPRSLPRIPGKFENAMTARTRMKVAMISVADGFGIDLVTAARASFKKAGLDVTYDVTYPAGTTDFTPIFNGVEAKHPDVMLMGIAHVGVQPTIQWHAQQVPIPA